MVNSGGRRAFLCDISSPACDRWKTANTQLDKVSLHFHPLAPRGMTRNRAYTMTTGF
jgi:hypothetical protein